MYTNKTKTRIKDFFIDESGKLIAVSETGRVFAFKINKLTLSYYLVAEEKVPEEKK